MHHLLIIKRPRLNKPTRDQRHSLLQVLLLTLLPGKRIDGTFTFRRYRMTDCDCPASLSMTTDHHNRRVWMINIYVIPFRPEMSIRVQKYMDHYLRSISMTRAEILRPSKLFKTPANETPFPPHSQSSSGPVFYRPLNKSLHMPTRCIVTHTWSPITRTKSRVMEQRWHQVHKRRTVIGIK